MSWRQLVSKAHDVVAAVDVEGFTGDGAGEIAGKEEGGASDFELVDVALERGAVFHEGPAAPLLTDLEYRKKILWL